jgi:hypothetical protein
MKIADFPLPSGERVRVRGEHKSIFESKKRGLRKGMVETIKGWIGLSCLIMLSLGLGQCIKRYRKKLLNSSSL